jgi:signal transduction histidine kinase/ActR/RegA family two-component response regulator
MAWTPSYKFTALERRVFLVAVASLLPVAILSCGMFISSGREQREQLLQVSEDTMAALVSAVDAELKSTVAALDALAASPRLARGEFAALADEARQLLERRPGWLNVVIADSNRQYLNARAPPGEPLPEISSRDLIEETLRTGRAMAGQVIYAPLLRTYAVAVLIPYRSKQGAQYIIAAVLRPESFLGLLDPLKLENPAARGVIAILDRQNNVVARSLDQESRVGKPASPTLIRMLAAGGDRGSAVTNTLEGVPVYTVFVRSSYSKWSAAVGIPRASVDGPVLNSYLLLGGAVFFSILLGLIAATLVGRTIVTPMAELEQSAARIGRGEPPGMPATRLGQVQRVAAALARAHDERAASFQREHEARLAAESASKAKDEFLAMLGHELRNPLAAITTASSLIERQRQRLDPSAALATDIITRQARHLARLTDDLLDAGRVILGKISLTRAPVDLGSAVAAVVEGLRSTGRVGGHQLDISLQPVWIFADSTRIDQVVGNLVTNALKYTPEGGRIAVSTRREGAQALLVVADTGIGLEPDLLPRAFDLFVQGERALDRSQGGLGIGLTLVRRLTELHGGTVTAESEGSGRGATFTVRLPAIDPPAVGVASSAGMAPSEAACIALIEDNADARMSLRMLLELDGHSVREAADGPAGVALIAGDERITLAFVDIGLPGMDGYAVAHAVRERRGRGVRLVAMSGYGSERDVAQGVEAGFDAYIVKPAELDELRSQVALARQPGKPG